VSKSAHHSVRAVVALGLPLLCACSSTRGPSVVSVEFENEVPGGHVRYLTVGDVSVSKQAPEYYDLKLASDRPGGMLISANGTRNFAEVGTGDESAFRKLAEQLPSLTIRELPEAATAFGITPGERPADYWTPGYRIVKPGTIIAVRHRQPGPAPAHDVRALVYVRSVRGKDEMVLLVARAPRSNDS
jgi:hypothetical protein